LNPPHLIEKSKRRDKLNIIAEILQISKNGTLKTQIMYKANLSFSQLGDYLQFMQNAKLLKQVDDMGKDVYVATEKGLDFLERHYELTQMLKEYENKSGIRFPPQKILKK
jgi:predicted transcriptional regulator